MSAAKHTTGLLSYRGDGIYFANNAGGFFITNCPSPEANARRIVACWNACEGISTEILEKVEAKNIDAQERFSSYANKIEDLNTSLARECAELEQQRDELLAALSGLHKVCEIALSSKDGGHQHVYFETRAGHFVAADEVMSAASAAIAKAGGAA